MTRKEHGMDVSAALRQRVLSICEGLYTNNRWWETGSEPCSEYEGPYTFLEIQPIDNCPFWVTLNDDNFVPTLEFSVDGEVLIEVSFKQDGTVDIFWLEQTEIVRTIIALLSD
ncbi:hypothetical protein HN358_00215 [Candidatus Uhrbacteria bacterium]|jgi:hypothetical protein|nr:hypothetical protein [Candidatus Uhrbacteria bacterium]MBT7717273.1 hypothetical protein [Candidatus Uhrbacteria bacterium]